MKKIFRIGDIPIISSKSCVFTNGCFDLLHPGHLEYLQKARSLGEALVVGLNSDDSIKRLKGSKRPICEFNFRARMLSYLDFVDFIVEFDEDDPLQLIKSIKPDFLVKGSDYGIDEIIGADYVQSYGGKVEPIDFLNGYSTTQVIEQIIKAYKND